MEFTEEPEEVQDMIRHMPRNIRIIEDQIDVNVQQEYLKLAVELKDERIDEDQAMEMLPNLYDDEADIELKKKTIVQLAQSSGVKSFRELEKFKEIADEDISEFARFGVHIARAMLESSLSDDNIGFVSSGLGGKGHLLRYFVCIFNVEEKTAFSPPQKKIIRKELELAIIKDDGELEKLNFKGEYAAFHLLLPIQNDFNTLIRNTLDEINQFGDFLFEGFFATNVQIPEHREIASVIREIRAKDKQEDQEEY